MEALELQKALSLEKRMYALLNEAFDISKQLAEAIERGDQVTIRILLSMRREPLESLQQDPPCFGGTAGRACARRRRVSWRSFSTGPRQRGRKKRDWQSRWRSTGRLLRQLVELDRILNRKLGGEKSLYHKSLDTSPTG